MRWCRSGLIGALLLCLFLLSAKSAKAACSGPDGTAGKLFFNADSAIMQYCDGTTWRGLGDTQLGGGGGGPAGCPNVGDLCSDGSYYIGQLGGNDIYATAAANESSQTWNNGTTNYSTTNTTSTTDGEGNTATLVGLTGNSDYPFDAAIYCDSLSAHDQTDWYLPAQDELNLLWNGGSPVAGVLTDSAYWSSTEHSDDTFAWYQWFDDGSQSATAKERNAPPMIVRCVRKDAGGGGGSGSGSCSNPGMPGGSIYFNEDNAVLLYCNGSDWVGLGVPAGGVVTSGLLHYWKFDEPNGSTAVDSAGASDGSLNMDAVFAPTGGIVGGAVSLDGTDDNVTIAPSGTADFPLGDFTWAAWIKPTDLTNRGVFGMSNAGNNIYSQVKWAAASDIEMMVNNTNVINNVGGFTADSTWQHVVIARTGSTLTAYRNGSAIDTQSNGTALDFGAGTCEFMIGSSGGCTGNTDGAWNHWNGLIDEVRIYDRGLSQPEVDELYQCGLAGDCSGGGYCANPTAAAGTIFYNADAKRHQYCNGDDWIGFILANDGTSGVGGGSPPVIEAFQGTSNNGTDNSQIVLNAPSGITAGELLLLIVGSEDAADGAYFNAVSGWTKVDESGSSVEDAHIAVYWRQATGSEGNVTVTAPSTDDIFGWYLRISGADTTSPVDASSFDAAGSSDPHTVPEITTTVDNTLAIFGLSFDGGDGDPFDVSGTGWAEEEELTAGTDSTSGAGVWGSKAMPTAGATGNVTVDVTGAGGADGAAYFQLAIKPQ